MEIRFKRIYRRYSYHTVSKKTILLIIFIFQSFSVINSQDTLKIKFRSRALMDATISDYADNKIKEYFRIEDFRAGFSARYMNNEIKVDMGYSNGEWKLKDFIYNYKFRKSTLSIGNMYEPFSMDMLISTADLRFNQSATSVQIFTNSRRLGSVFHSYDKNYYFATGVFLDSDINNISQNTGNSYILTNRGVWIKSTENKKSMLHIGGAVSLCLYRNNSSEESKTTLKSYGITSMFSQPLLTADINCIKNKLKAMTEILYVTNKIMLQSEYFIQNINRSSELHNYFSHGGYIQGSFLIKGKGFDYDSKYAVPCAPKSDNSIELAVRVNYTDMNHYKANIMGGEEFDFSVGMNYYFSKYFGAKINLSFVDIGKNCNSFYNKNLLLFQTRIQYIF